MQGLLPPQRAPVAGNWQGLPGAGQPALGQRSGGGAARTDAGDAEPPRRQHERGDLRAALAALARARLPQQPARPHPGPAHTLRSRTWCPGQRVGRATSRAGKSSTEPLAEFGQRGGAGAPAEDNDVAV